MRAQGHVGRRGVAASAALTGAVVFALIVVMGIGSVIVALFVAGASPENNVWDDLTSVVTALLIGTALVPVVAALVLRTLGVPRIWWVMLAATATVLLDLWGRGFLQDAYSPVGPLYGMVLVSAGWAALLHPSVLRLPRGVKRR